VLDVPDKDVGIYPDPGSGSPWKWQNLGMGDPGSGKLPIATTCNSVILLR